MSHFQHLCTAWHNRTRPVRRRGPLWAGRFKNTVMEPGRALWACWTYVERNPVRAKICADPADYRFCSYGEWTQTSRHPFADAVARFLAPALPTPFAASNAADALDALKARFTRDAAEEVGQRETSGMPPHANSCSPPVAMCVTGRTDS